MNVFVEIFHERLLPAAALSRWDQKWADALRGSICFKIWLAFKAFCNRLSAPLARLGSACQGLSFLSVVLLFLILAAPQFTNDKEGLALIVTGAFALRLFGSLLGGKETWQPRTQDILVLAFLAINLIATAASHYLYPSIKGLAKLSVYICAYFLFVMTLENKSQKRSRIILSALLFAGFAQALYGLYQYKIGVAPLATWEDPNIEEKTTRIYGTLLNPNLLAGYFVPLIPLSLGTAITQFCEKGWRKLTSLPFFVAGGALLVACFMTGSRGGYMGAAVGIGALGFMLLCQLWLSKPKARIWLLAIGLLLPILLVLVLHQFPAYEHRITSIFAGREHSSNSYRLNVYASSWKMFLDSWWLGIGPGNSTFRLAYGLYMKSGFDALGTYCVPLEIAVECGIFGLGIFALFIFSLLSRAHMTFWQTRSYKERWIVAGAAAGLLAVMVHGLVDTVFYRPQIQLIFWLMTAIVVSMRPEQETPEK